MKHLGREAQGLLENVAFREAVQRLEDMYRAKWLRATDPTERDRIWMLTNNLHDLVRQLRAIFDSAYYEDALDRQASADVESSNPKE